MQEMKSDLLEVPTKARFMLTLPGTLDEVKGVYIKKNLEPRAVYPP